MSNSFIDRTAGAVEHCETMIKSLPAEAQSLVTTYYQPMMEACQQKLWHPLTLLILKFVHDPTVGQLASSVNASPYLAVYDKIVLAVEKQLHPLSLGRIASAVAYSLLPDLTAATGILENLLTEKENDVPIAAVLYLQSRLGLLQLNNMEENNNNNSMLAMIRTNQSKLQEASNMPALVHAAHYELAMMYYKSVGPPEAFFAQAMSFLHYAPPPPRETSAAATTTTATTDYRQLAMDLCLAALTGEAVYNLSQVVQEHGTTLLPLLQPDHGWLVQLLEATAHGHVTEFQQLTVQYESEIAKQPALVHRAVAVKEKLTLLALVDLVFHKPSHHRRLSFTEIAQQLQITADQVEWVVMRALSVHLLEGTMDQLEQVVDVTWVVPRVLAPSQVQDLADRYGVWAGKVQEVQTSMVGSY